MSLFQCEHCGCCENTALTSIAIWHFPDDFDWSGIEDRKGKKLCSACGPARYSDGTTKTRCGQWHRKFRRTYLPKGMFHTNREGNLEHNETGSCEISQYAIPGPSHDH